MKSLNTKDLQKSWQKLIIVGVSLISFACAKENKTTAAVPAPATAQTVDQNCLTNPNDVRCLNQNSNYYNNYNNQGWSTYPVGNNYNYDNGNLYCNCPDGSRPTYHPQYGLGCVLQSNVQSLLSFSFYIGFGSNGRPQNYQTSYFYPVSQNCYSQAVYSCTVNNPTTCPQGSYCRQTQYNSPLGICQQSY